MGYRPRTMSIVLA